LKDENEEKLCDTQSCILFLSETGRKKIVSFRGVGNGSRQNNNIDFPSKKFSIGEHIEKI
jgi:hypothetical protein